MPLPIQIDHVGVSLPATTHIKVVLPLNGLGLQLKPLVADGMPDNPLDS